jgi:hypothetical protein
VSELPIWFQYLQSAYPRQRFENPGQTAAIINQHFDAIELPESDRMEVSRRITARSEWWPAVAQLREVANEVLYEKPPEKRISGLAAWEKRRPSFLKREAELKLEREGWPVCQDCGEHTPNLGNCPFCLDIETMVAN